MADTVDEWKARAELAEHERDEWKARADDLDKQLAKVVSDYQDVEDERDEWKARAEEWQAAAAKCYEAWQR